MISTNDIQPLEIIKNAVVDYFLPLTKLIRILNYLGSDDDVLMRLDKKEKKISTINKSLSSYISLTNELKQSLSYQEKIIKILLERDHAISNKYIQEHLFHYTTRNINTIVNEKCDLTPVNLSKKVLRLSKSNAEEGIAKIEYILREFISRADEAPYIFGINNGGNYMASYLASRINLHEKYIVKCDFRVDLDKVYSEERQDIKGPIILIDDISRTGNTMRKIMISLKHKYPLSDVFSVVLVKCTSKNDDKSDVINYSPYTSTSKELTFPWDKEATGLKSFFVDNEIDEIIRSLETKQDIT